MFYLMVFRALLGTKDSENERKRKRFTPHFKTSLRHNDLLVLFHHRLRFGFRQFITARLQALNQAERGANSPAASDNYS